jgi:hypothetical protein
LLQNRVYFCVSNPKKFPPKGRLGFLFFCLRDDQRAAAAAAVGGGDNSDRTRFA